MLIISSTGSVIGMGLFIYFGNIYILALLGLFLFASGAVLMASVQDTHTNMPTFMNSMYMSISFSISSIVVFSIGLLGGSFGLQNTYLICNVFALGSTPAACLLTKFIK